MDEPVTGGDVAIVVALLFLIPPAFRLMLMLLDSLDSVGERWASRGPRWKNSWEEDDDDGA